MKVFNVAVALPLALALVSSLACSPTRRVPRGGQEEMREYMRVATRAPALAERVDSAPQQIWRATRGRGTLGQVALGDRLAAVATVDRFVYLLDARTGAVLWRARGDNPFVTGPLIAYGRVFAATGSTHGQVQAMSLYTGKRRWVTSVGDVAAPLVMGDTTVYGVTQQGRVFALKSGNGAVRWTRRTGPARSAPLLAGTRIAVATLTDSLWVLDAWTGRPLVRVPLPGGTASPLALVDDTTAALASPSGVVTLVTLTTGAVRWRREIPGRIFGTPVIARDTVFALANDCTLWALPVADPAAADSLAMGCTAVAPPVLTRDGVLVATLAGELLYYDRTARRRVWSRTVRGELRQPPALRNGQIVIMPSVGDIVSFR